MREMHQTWQAKLRDEFQKTYFSELVQFVREERIAGEVYPHPGQVFNAFEVPLDKVRVVILGQDPYHGPGQAHGLAFSVLPGVRVPPSLANVYKELESDLGNPPVKHGYLYQWTKYGVFLLNTTLTVRRGEAGSHRGRGWETFTDRVIRELVAQEKRIVFVLWGRDAGEKAFMIDTSKHSVIVSSHPSPMSAHSGFFGSKPFSRANAALEKKGRSPVDWKLPDQV
jgi:uracil-DNA glycosylase